MARVRTAPGWLPLLAALVVPVGLAGQAGAGSPRLTPAEAEALQMSQQMTFVCSPQRSGALRESESMIRREAGPLTGTASYLRTAEGTFLVLEGYDADQAGHCLVLAWFGGELEPGSYAIRQLSMAAMEEEVGAQDHSFFTFSAVRAPDESHTHVTQGGSLEIEAVEQGAVSGHFELTGFTVSSQERVDGVALEGTFRAMEDGL